jgi:hypothetical protein
MEDLFLKIREEAEEAILQFVEEKLTLRYDPKVIYENFSNVQLRIWQLPSTNNIPQFEFNLYVNEPYYNNMIYHYSEINTLLREALFVIDTSFLNGPIVGFKIYRSSNIIRRRQKTFLFKNNNFITQCTLGNTQTYIYNSMRFRSISEIKIAEELDKRNICYSANVPMSIGGIVKEIDFLIQHPITLQFGILEVNGPQHTNSAKDHDRARLLFERGMVCIFYTATDAYNQPSWVVDNFLNILGKFTSGTVKNFV